MELQPGDQVERLRGDGENRFGRIQRRAHEDSDTWYVTVGVGLTHIDNGRDLRLIEESDSFKPDP
jgi:hypothetical protein